MLIGCIGYRLCACLFCYLVVSSVLVCKFEFGFVRFMFAACFDVAWFGLGVAGIAIWFAGFGVV